MICAVRAPAVLAILFLTLGSAIAQQRTPGSLPRPLSPRSANYVIDVRLDPASRTLAGRESLVWINTSAAATSELQFHLYYNAWRSNQSTYMKETQRTGFRIGRRQLGTDELSAIDVSSVKITGGAIPAADLTASIRFVANDDGNEEDRTVMAVTMPAAVQPNQSMTVEIAWTSKIPRAADRTGVMGRQFFLGQWFPKIGVLRNDGTWNCHQFHSATEFFSDYGVYDVRMTVPQGWALGATGEERERVDHPDGTTTHRYYQEDVHDFAWTTSPDYLERRQRFEEAGLPPVDMRLLIQPEHISQADRHFSDARAALRYYGQWLGAYPYGHLTIVDPAWQSAADGMEYPTLFTAGTNWLTPPSSTPLDDTVVHEAGHQWLYGMVASNEFEDAWMDEGINQFVNARVDAELFGSRGRLVRRYFGGFVPWTFSDIRWDRVTFGEQLYSYRSGATQEVPSTPSYQYWPGNPISTTYSKPALWLHTLERALGWPTMQRILSAYFERWQFRHPRPEDFFQVANEQSGKDLTPFFDQVYRGSSTFDFGVESLNSEPAGKDNYRTNVVVRRYGDGIFPVTVLVTFSDGVQTRTAWDGGNRWTLISLEHAAEAVSAQVDPDQVLLLDTNFTNNSYAMAPQGPRAATKWAAAWMVWLQDQLITWAFFV